MVWLLVAIGGASGATLRYGVGRLAAHYLGADTVVGTLAVNIAGSFALGLLATLFLARAGMLPVELRAMATVGLLGGFTTFSTLAYDGVRLLAGGEWAAGGRSHRRQCPVRVGRRLSGNAGRAGGVLTDRAGRRAGPVITPLPPPRLSANPSRECTGNGAPARRPL